MFAVRGADRSDLKSLIVFCREMHVDSRYEYIPIHQRTLHNTVEQVLTSPHGAAWVAEVDGKIEGALIAIANQLWFSRKKEAVDLFFYVSPKASGAGAIMIRKYLTWARLTPGIVRVMIGVTSGEQADRTGKFFEAMGGVKVGGMYVVDIDPEQDDEQCSQDSR